VEWATFTPNWGGKNASNASPSFPDYVLCLCNEQRSTLEHSPSEKPGYAPDQIYLIAGQYMKLHPLAEIGRRLLAARWLESGVGFILKYRLHKKSIVLFNNVR